MRRPFRPWEHFLYPTLAGLAVGVPVSGVAIAQTTSALLTVTWISLNQPPSSYQISFPSMAACEKARRSVVADAARLAKEYEPHNSTLADGRAVVTNPGPPPHVSAVCVQK